MIDDRLEVRTPEGVDLALHLAGPLPRAAAWVLDLLIRGGIYIVLMLTMAAFGDLGMGLLLIGIFLLEWFYPVLFEAWRNGQTPGKRALGIAVVHADGTPLSFNASIIRNLLRAADFFPVAYLTGFICMLCSPRFQRLGDLAADTVVVHVEQPPAPSAGQGPGMTPVWPDWAMTRADQQTLVAYLERGDALTQERRQELAQQAFPEKSPAQAERQLRALAQTVAGQA